MQMAADVARRVEWLWRDLAKVVTHLGAAEVLSHWPTRVRAAWLAVADRRLHTGKWDKYFSSPPPPSSSSPPSSPSSAAAAPSSSMFSDRNRRKRRSIQRRRCVADTLLDYAIVGGSY